MNPFAFEAVDHIRNGYRRCLCGSDTLYYRTVNNQVEIMSIFGNQDYDVKLKNDKGNRGSNK